MWDVTLKIGGDERAVRVYVLRPCAMPDEADFRHAVRTWLLRNRGPGISFSVLAVRQLDGAPEMTPFAGTS